MAEQFGGRDGGLRRFVLYVSILGWVATIVAIALFMRIWIPDVDLKAELDAIEQADTEDAETGGSPSVLQPLAGPLPAFSVSGATYVPLYGGLYVGGKRSLKNLSATLSLRNLATDDALIFTTVSYLNAGGEAVGEALDAPQVLAPLATAEFYIDRSDLPGGDVAAVVVEWGGETSTAPPLIEAVILGNYGAKSISFVSRGQLLP